MQTQCVSKRIRMAIAVIIACALAVVNTSMWAASNHDRDKTCSNGTLSGDYGLTIEGLLNSPGGSVTLRGVVLQTYDGKGNITMVDHVVIAGVPPPPDTPWRPGTGTYEVNPDCTGRAMLFPGATNNPPLVVYFVIVKHGQMIRQVVNGSAVIATGNKLDD